MTRGSIQMRDRDPEWWRALGVPDAGPCVRSKTVVIAKLEYPAGRRRTLRM